MRRAMMLVGGILVLAVALAVLLSPIWHRSARNGFFILSWTLLALFSVRYQWSNWRDSLLDWQLVLLPEFAVDQKRVRRALFNRRVNATRMVVVPLMLIVGALALFTPERPNPPHQTIIEAIEGVVLLLALYLNEGAFAIINYLEYHQRRKFRGET